METLCPAPRLAVPASPRGSPCSPTPRKPRRGTQEFSPLCLRALAFCALAKPRASSLGLGPGEPPPRAPVLLGPCAPLRTAGWAPDGLKHLGGQAERSSDPNAAAGEDADVAVCPGRREEEEGGGSFPHFGARPCAPPGPCPASRRPRESPTSSASSPPRPDPGLESQPGPATSPPQELCWEEKEGWKECFPGLCSGGLQPLKSPKSGEEEEEGCGKGIAMKLG
ncbi:hypothetical protein TREES_T100019945 [Tupaia chinensis]|uniref:Uncharacterized protein n=1 Tax=Tupaia chinensis TaxID=246437 RepID=L8Y667_TUPCH|nr:hypothetical protein TREES_T100019945 [Tupaia chinensis]